MPGLLFDFRRENEREREGRRKRAGLGADGGISRSPAALLASGRRASASIPGSGTLETERIVTEWMETGSPSIQATDRPGLNSATMTWLGSAKPLRIPERSLATRAKHILTGP